MSRERWLDEALEASDRALFTRRARALPPPKVPHLGAILAAADTRREGHPRTAGRVGALVALSLGVAAAGVLLLGAASSLVTHTRGPRAILPDEGDASVSRAAAWASYEPPVCEPSPDEPGSDETCAAVPASLVVATSDTVARACVESQESVGRADDFGLGLACTREPQVSSP